MEHLPEYVGLLIGLTAVLAIYLFWRSAYYSRSFIWIAVVWVAIQTILGLSGFYHLSIDTPPNMPMLVAPPTLLILGLFLTGKGRIFIDRLNTARLTLVHSVAIFVELVFYLLFLYRYVPKIMTFEGFNFDLLSGITAPLVYYYGFVRMKLNRPVLIAWNLICLLLVINASAFAVLSLPPGFRHIGAEQPDLALGVFPFTLVPAVIVPLVLFSHLAALRHLIIKNNNYKKSWKTI